jgi:hypothetical protein
MQPRPIAPTVGPVLPSLRVFMRVTLPRPSAIDKPGARQATLRKQGYSPQPY